jgi:hypothetical protein
MKKCYFCKQEINGSACVKCAEENDIAAAVTYFYEKDHRYECNQATLMLTYNDKIAMANLYFDKNASYNNKLVVSISNVTVNLDDTLIFNEALTLYNVNITPQNIKEKLKTYLLFK